MKCCIRINPLESGYETFSAVQFADLPVATSMSSQGASNCVVVMGVWLPLTLTSVVHASTCVFGLYLPVKRLHLSAGDSFSCCDCEISPVPAGSVGCMLLI